jgi:hypothetical protein
VLSPLLFSYADLARHSVPEKQIEEEADCIVSVFLDGNYNFGPSTLAIKRAADNGVPYYQVGWTRDTTSRFAVREILPPAGKEKNFFRKVAQVMDKGSGGPEDIKELVKALKEALSPIIVVGPEILDLTDGHDILKSLERIMRLADAAVYAPNPFGNLMGLLSAAQIKSPGEIHRLIDRGKIDFVYIVGDVPFQERPPVKFVVFQGDFPPPEKLEADLILPAATWGEISGTYADLAGKKKKIKAIANPPGLALTHQEIFTRIARGVGQKEIKFSGREFKKSIPDRLEIVNPGPAPR